MRVLSRRELGYEDEFEGFMFFKEDEPAAQVHLYDDYYTFFWRGRAGIEALGQCLGKSIEEICRKLGQPFESLNKGVAQYALAGGVRSVPFEVLVDRWSRPKLRFNMEDPQKTFGKGAPPVAFIRLDVDSSLNLPIILWSDLQAVEDAEVGFSTTAELPAAVLQLLQRTCRVDLSDKEVEELHHLVLNQIFIGRESEYPFTLPR